MNNNTAYIYKYRLEQVYLFQTYALFNTHDIHIYILYAIEFNTHVQYFTTNDK